MLVLTGNMPSNGVVSGECSRAKWARDPNALMPLSDMGTKVGFVSVQSVAVQAL